MFMHFGLLISLFCAACVGGTEQQPDNTPQWPITDDGALNVYGELIDVRNVAKESVYPINSDYLYNESLPSEVAKLKCAVGVKEMRGVEKMACSQVCGVYVASTAPIKAPGWSDLGKSFNVANESGTKSVEYSLYRYKIETPMQSGRSNFRFSRLTEIGHRIAVRPRMQSTLKMFEPTTLPIATSTLPCNAP